MFDSFFRRGHEQKIAANERYHSLAHQADEAITNLITDDRPLSEKARRRIQEFCHRRDNIALVWVKKGPTSLEETVGMLEELIQDTKKFDPTKFPL